MKMKQKKKNQISVDEKYKWIADYALNRDNLDTV